jgi:hypothetical protein
VEALGEAVAECRAIVAEATSGPPEVGADAPLPSLLEQINSYLNENDPGQTPLASVHHFACTGGTLIGRCLAAMPNVCLLSEVDPLSTIAVNRRRPYFAPTDLIKHLRYSLRDLDEEIIAETYLAALEAAKRGLERSGLRLIIRDHTHSHYCVDGGFTRRASHRELLRGQFDLKSIVTVRDPIESFISLQKLGAVNFSPPSLDEYARRYNGFLDDHADVPVYRYEDFVAEPDFWLARMCEELKLCFVPDFQALIGPIVLTGDSGRKGAGISPRPPKTRSPGLETEARNSASFQALSQRLGY